MKLNSKRVDLEYQPGEEIFTFPGETGLPFIFDVSAELTGNREAMNAVVAMLDETEALADQVKSFLKDTWPRAAGPADFCAGFQS